MSTDFPPTPERLLEALKLEGVSSSTVATIEEMGQRIEFYQLLLGASQKMDDSDWEALDGFVRGAEEPKDKEIPSELLHNDSEHLSSVFTVKSAPIPSNYAETIIESPPNDLKQFCGIKQRLSLPGAMGVDSHGRLTHVSQNVQHIDSPSDVPIQSQHTSNSLENADTPHNSPDQELGLNYSSVSFLSVDKSSEPSVAFSTKTQETALSQIHSLRTTLVQLHRFGSSRDPTSFSHRPFAQRNNQQRTTANIRQMPFGPQRSRSRLPALRRRLDEWAEQKKRLKEAEERISTEITAEDSFAVSSTKTDEEHAVVPEQSPLESKDQKSDSDKLHERAQQTSIDIFIKPVQTRRLRSDSDWITNRIEVNDVIPSTPPSIPSVKVTSSATDIIVTVDDHPSLGKSVTPVDEPSSSEETDVTPSQIISTEVSKRKTPASHDRPRRRVIKRGHRSMKRRQLISQASHQLPAKLLKHFHPSRHRSFPKDVQLPFAGIHNHGTTCSLSSILQLLLHQIPFQKLLNEQTTEETPWSDESVEETGGNQQALQLTNNTKSNSSETISSALLDLLAILQRGKVATSKHVASLIFGWMSRSDWNVQRDAHELLQQLLDKLEKERGESVRSLFSGRRVYYTQCLDVPHRSERREPFWELELLVYQNNSLQESLKREMETERLDGENKFLWERLGISEKEFFVCPEVIRSYHEADRGVFYKELPPMLLVHPIRADFSFDEGVHVVQQVWSFQEYEDFSPLLQMEQEDQPKEKETCNYELRAMVVHTGKSDSGHYYTYAKMKMKWIFFNDTLVQRADTKQMWREAFGKRKSARATVLLYIKQDYL